MAALFLLPKIRLTGSEIFQIHFSRFVPSIVDLVHTERKKLAQLCKRSLADALEKR